MKFKEQLTKPDAGNRYYIPIADGGVNPCIAKPAGSTLPFQNCVFYAWGRFNEIAEATNLLRSTNAENFCNIAKEYGLEVGTTPRLGAIACWAKGKVGDASDGAGHVAIVEQIHADGSITTSESGWSASKAFWTTHRKNDGNWRQSASYRFLGFIYNPAVSDADGEEASTDSPTQPIRKGDHGDAVRWLQAQLIRLGYLRATERDGDFGRITLGAVCAFQLEHALEVDGVCGSKTRAALQAPAL